MPPRYAYWTIVAGGLPTAFRAAEREELLPTFKRIQGKHPDAEMKYFARGQLWASQEDARRAAEARRAADRPGVSRGRDWRPGGEHRDPRQKFKDAKKERNLDWRKKRFDRRQESGAANRSAQRAARPEWRDHRPRSGKAVEHPSGSPLRRQPRWQPRADARPAGPKGSSYKTDATRRDREWRHRPPREKSHGDPLRRQTPRPFARNQFARNQGTEQPKAPPQPKGPNREPTPGEVPKPAPPPRPSEPAIPPPGPPKRGRPAKDRRRRS